MKHHQSFIQRITAAAAVLLLPLLTACGGGGSGGSGADDYLPPLLELRSQGRETSATQISISGRIDAEKVDVDVDCTAVRAGTLDTVPELSIHWENSATGQSGRSNVSPAYSTGQPRHN